MARNYIMWEGGSCPGGWTANSNMNNRFLRANPAVNPDFDDVNGENSSSSSPPHLHLGTTTAGPWGATEPPPAGTKIALELGTIVGGDNNDTGYYNGNFRMPFTQKAADDHPETLGLLSGESGDTNMGAINQHAHTIYLRGNVSGDPWVDDADSTSDDGDSGSVAYSENEYKNILFCYKEG